MTSQPAGWGSSRSGPLRRMRFAAEVPEEGAGGRVDLFCVEADVAGKGGKLIHEGGGVLDLAGACRRLDAGTQVRPRPPVYRHPAAGTTQRWLSVSGTTRSEVAVMRGPGRVLTFMPRSLMIQGLQPRR